MEINLITPICATGYGVAGANLVAALLGAGHDVALFPRGALEVAEEFELAVQKSLGNQAFYDPRAPSVRLADKVRLAKQVGKGLHCGFTIFELDRFSKPELHHLGCLDRVFVCSRWARDLLLAHGMSADRVHVVPLGVDRDIFHPAVASPDRSPAETVFVSVGKFELRKGHDVLVEAFNAAFEPSDPVRLAVHGWNPLLAEAGNRRWTERFKTSKMGERITVSAQRLQGPREIARFMAQADCGVFPARAEGWNLELLEMMALGKTVIATDYSGHTEFVSAENCLLIPITELEEAHDGMAFRGQGCWASFGKVQRDLLVHCLREVHRLKQSGELGVNLAGIETAKRFSWDAAAARLVEGLG